MSVHVVLAIEPCDKLDCRHELHRAVGSNECNPMPPCLLWPGTESCSNCLDDGSRVVLDRDAPRVEKGYPLSSPTHVWVEVDRG